MRALFAALLWCCAVPAWAADSVSENAMKAAYLFNFAKFIDWPGGIGVQFNICALGEHSLGRALDSLEGKSVKERGVHVLHLAGAEAARNCQIAFVGDGLSGRELAALGEAGVLTVGDDDGFLDQGGHIVLARDGDRVVFDVNLPAMRRARLAISARLLKVARSVR